MKTLSVMMWIRSMSTQTNDCAIAFSVLW